MATPTEDNGSNHRVTNAILSTKLDNLIEEVRKTNAAMERRMNFLEEKLEIECSAGRVRSEENSQQIARLDERQKAWTGILGALTLIGTAIGSAFGLVK